MKHQSCLRFKRGSYDVSLTAIVKEKMGQDARLVTGPGQVVYGVLDSVVKKLPSWVQQLPAEQRNRIW